MHEVRAHIAGVVFSVDVATNDVIAGGAQIVLLESMKMHHGVAAGVAGRVVEVLASVGQSVQAGEVIARVDVIAEKAFDDETTERTADPSGALPERKDRAELAARRAQSLDDARPEAVTKRHGRNQRTARQNLAHLVDDGTFVEYGQFAVAAQKSRRDQEDLAVNTAADGIVTGIASVNGDVFGQQRSRAAVLAYDYAVLAGTQGFFGHHKTDRMLDIAKEQRLPVIFYTEGGGGRPGDVDVSSFVPTGLTVPTFATWASLSGLVPRISIASGFCFAGNAAIWGSADVTIATKDSWIGLGGPAMISGGGLGEFAPTEIGPSDVQVANGSIDLLANDEAHATELARTVLSYFQGSLESWDAPNVELLRDVVPEDRRVVYNVRDAIGAIFDVGSVTELRTSYGVGMVTSLARLEGRPVGVIANDPTHLSGAIDAVGAQKAARFMQLCDAFDLPVISLFDTPGFMVGPESEEQAAVRKVSSLFVVGASLTVPIFAVCLRKGYGLGAQAMCGGSFREPVLTAAWPTGEFGGMGLEGAVALGFSKELEAAPTPEARRELEDRLIAEAYERGKAVEIAQSLEIDAVIDPAETRAVLLRGLASTSLPANRLGKKRSFIDTW